MVLTITNLIILINVRHVDIVVYTHVICQIRYEVIDECCTYVKHKCVRSRLMITELVKKYVTENSLHS